MDTLRNIINQGAEWDLALRAALAWLLTSGLRVLLILGLAWLLLRALRAGLRRFEAVVHDDDHAGRENSKRTRTLIDMLQNVVSVAIVAITVLTVLQELGVNIMPILTGAGILGLAVGFGAQTLVKDIISGFFFILENQVRVGDVAQINGTGGLVEAINLRTIVLRNQGGIVHIFPCGSVTTLSNLSKDFSYALLDIGVAYKHDTDDVVAVLKATADELQATTEFGALMLEPIEIVGVEAFGDWVVTIRIRMKTLPLKQWTIAREYRRRIKKAFDAAGIEIPFPQCDVIEHRLPQQAESTD
ncbi:MAG: mechanosensitive ion channel [Acidobacteria bacterium]|nr:mechanosensitive ion channel [Acidobacteriota bacterium]